MPLSIALFAVWLFFATSCESPSPRPAISSASATDAPATVRTADVDDPDPDDLRLFEEAMTFARAEQLHERPLGEIMVALGERFLGKPYVAGMLDEPDEEQLICSLNGFDCVTFVETTLAMARQVRDQDYTYETFADHVRDTRYRGGEMDGYCSRMHYFSEWIWDNEQRGTVENVTEAIGGEPLDKRINFMTAHRKSYPKLARNDVFECIRQMEADLADVALFYVPKNRIHSVYDELQAGDIVATATSIAGLDVTHTGLVYDNGDGTRGFLHASTSGGVKRSPDLHDYMKNLDKQIGIIVARPMDR